MGNSASSSRSHHDDSVDYGFLVPQGVYTGPRDWDQRVVTQLIIERRLAPFYRPLEDYDPSWDDEQILAARKVISDPDAAAADAGARTDTAAAQLPSSRPGSINSPRRTGSLKEPNRIPEAMIYRDAVECPICFLYYPPNINRSRCCDQTICTECFVQIKRAEPTTTHVVSEPAACPYCVQDNFGVIYQPPPWRAGIGAEASSNASHNLTSSRTPSQQSVDSRGRRKSFSADSPEVVTIDHIRPDWEAKLAAVRAAVQRRANRRIIMRQVGDRLIPVGVTSGRLHVLANGEIPLIGDPNIEGPIEGESRSARRSRRRQHQQPPSDMVNMFGAEGMAGQDLEELMVMEAMRLSLIEHEEQQRKEAEKKRKEEAAKDKGSPASRGSGSGPAVGLLTERPDLPPIPPSTSFNIPGFRASAAPRAIPSSLTVDSSLGGSSPNIYSQRSSFESPQLRSTGLPSSLGAVSADSGSRSHSRTTSATASRTSVGPNAVSSHAEDNSRSENGSVLTSQSSNEAPQSVTISLTGVEPHTQPDTTQPVELTSQETSNNLPAQQPETVANESSVSLESGDNTNRSSIYDELPSSPESLSQRPLLLPTPVADNVDAARAFGISSGVAQGGNVDSA